MDSKFNADNLADLTVTADTAEAEKEFEAAAVPEKFKDVKTLIKAYSDLEAEFTRRSQRLKELESGNKTAAPPDAADRQPSHVSESEFIESALSNSKVRDAVIGDYLKAVAEGKGVPLLSGGGGVAAPKNAPKSVKEAGRLAQRFFKG